MISYAPWPLYGFHSICKTLQFLVKNVEPLFIKHKQMKSIMEEYRDRLLHPNAMRLHIRYTSKHIYHASMNTARSALIIEHYDLAKKSWKEIKTIYVQSMRDSGMVVVNDLLYVMGGNSGICTRNKVRFDIGIHIGIW